MFHKTNSKAVATKSTAKKDNTPSVITKDVNLIGNIISEGNVDFDGNLNGNIRCTTLTIRPNGCVKGEIVANSILVYGIVKGLIRAKHVQLFAHCNVEGIIMHETISIEDGAMVDGKFKRTDKVQPADEESDADFSFDDSALSEAKVLENIRLIR